MGGWEWEWEGLKQMETFSDLFFSSSSSIKFPPTFLILGRGRLGVGGTEIDGDRHWPLSLESLYDKIPPWILICKYSGHVFKDYIICAVEMLTLGYDRYLHCFLKNEASLTPPPHILDNAQISVVKINGRREILKGFRFNCAWMSCHLAIFNKVAFRRITYRVLNIFAIDVRF